MTDLLTILIPTLPRRWHFYVNLRQQLAIQTIGGKPVEIITDDATDISIGMKRNKLMAQVETPYVCFVDDDDEISINYIDLILAGIATNPDCCSLNGIITTDGNNPRVFKHSIEYDSMYERDGVYYRPVNHLNVVRTDIAKLCPFPDWNYSEDSNYCFQLQATGLLRKECKIEETLYYYLFRSDKKILG